MDLKPFKLDIDELINKFAEGGSLTLAEMKGVWLSKKFTFMFEACPSTNQGCFMQSLYAHAISYMVSGTSLSHKLGGLYCLYCLYETQPFDPPFRIYLSLGELRKLRSLVGDARAKDVKGVSALAKKMLDRNLFLFGFVDLNEGCVRERVDELTKIQNARVARAYEKLFANSQIERFIHMDMGMELDVDLLKQKSSDYAVIKELAINEAKGVVDIQNMKHIAENQRLIGDTVARTVEDWNVQKELFDQQTGFSHPPLRESSQRVLEYSEQTQHAGNYMDNGASEDFRRQDDNGNSEEQENGEDFGKELEVLLSEEDIALQNDDDYFQE